MKVKIKKLVEHAQVPEYAKPGDAGLDLVAIDCCTNYDYSYVEFGTGLALEIPEGYVGLVFPRSSISKTSYSFCNSVGVIDSGYRGEVMVRMRFNNDTPPTEYGIGDKIAQLVIIPYPKIELVEVTELSTTERGTGGFGSSGA